MNRMTQLDRRRKFEKVAAILVLASALGLLLIPVPAAILRYVRNPSEMLVSKIDNLNQRIRILEDRLERIEKMNR